MNMSYNVTFMRWQVGGTARALTSSNNSGWLDYDNLYNGNENRVNFTTGISNLTNTSLRNTTWTSGMFNDQRCSVWPSTCTWDIILNTSITLANARNSYLNFTLRWFQYTWNYTPDTFSPNTSLINPDTGIWTKSPQNYLYYNVTDEKDVFNCSLLINNKINITNFTITKNIEMNFSSILSDGFYNWSVNCTDNTSLKNIGNSSTRILKVDLTPPNISLEKPQNNSMWTLSSNVLLQFNGTDNLGNITCKLYVDDLEDQTKIDTIQGSSQNFTASQPNGYHNWSVNCTDEAGNTGQSLRFNFSMNFSGPAIYTDLTDYEEGEFLFITGSNWGIGVNVSVNLTKINGVKLNWTVQANATGYFNLTYWVNYSDPIGRYNLTAMNISGAAANRQNSTTYFNVLARPVFVMPNRTTFYEGEIVYINGTGMSPNATVEINITSPTTIYLLTITANGTGHFNTSWLIPYTGPPGTYNLSAIDSYYRNLNYTTNFTVNNRVATVATDLATYFQYNLVVVNGSWYYPGGLVTLWIKNLDSGGNKTWQNYSNYAGDIGTIWNVSDACGGNYSVLTQDFTRAELTAELNFTIDPDVQPYNLTALPESLNWSGPSAIVNTNLSKITISDNDYQNITPGSNVAGKYILEVNFTTNVPSEARIINMTLISDQYVSSAARIINYTLEWYNGTSFQQLCMIAPPAVAERSDYCEVTRYIPNGTAAGHMNFRLTYGKTALTALGYVDFVRININYTTPKSCTPWVNLAPTFTSSYLDDVFTDLSRQIDLNAGSSVEVKCNATVRDMNGASDIVGMNATIYFAGNETSLDDPRTHYTNDSCPCSATGLNDARCVCSVWVQYYAENGTWYCNASVLDQGGATAVNLTNATINSLLSVNLTTEANLVLDFGNILPGENSTSSKVVNITNSGNQPLNITVYAYANLSGDNRSLYCPTSDSWVDASFLRYNITDQGWVGMYTTNGSFAQIPNLIIPRQMGSSASINQTYWRLALPIGVSGTCNGSLVFGASAS